MSSAKKRRAINRAIEEHDRAKLSAQIATSNHTMLDMAESVLAKQVERVTAELATLQTKADALAKALEKTQETLSVCLRNLRGWMCEGQIKSQLDANRAALATYKGAK